MSYFGELAIKTFADGLSALTGRPFEVVVRPSSGADIDGQKIVLPRQGIWDEDGFRALCGTAAHKL